MNWLDIVFIVVLIVMVAAGAKVGSVWTSACLGAGFLGMAVVEIFGMAVAERLGPGAYSPIAANVLVFLAGALAVLIPGWILDRIASVVMLDVVNGIFGFFTGLFAVIILVVLGALLIVPSFPQVEKTVVWKKSKLVRPLQSFLEQKIERPR